VREEATTLAPLNMRSKIGKGKTCASELKVGKTCCQAYELSSIGAATLATQQLSTRERERDSHNVLQCELRTAAKENYPITKDHAALALHKTDVCKLVGEEVSRATAIKRLQPKRR